MTMQQLRLEDHRLLYRSRQTRREFVTADIEHIEVQHRSSFRHPFFGVVAMLLFAAPMAYVLVSSIHTGSWNLLSSPLLLTRRGAGVWILFLAAAYIGWCLIRSRRIPWLRITVDGKRHDLPVFDATLEEVQLIVNHVRSAKPVAVTPG